jgi:hypothetical protein
VPLPGLVAGQTAQTGAASFAAAVKRTPPTAVKVKPKIVENITSEHTTVVPTSKKEHPTATHVVPQTTVITGVISRP